MMARSYYIKLEALSGLLVGGVKSTQSSRFESRRDAIDWAIIVKDLNHEADRHVNPKFETVASDLEPEIPAPSWYRTGGER